MSINADQLVAIGLIITALGTLVTAVGTVINGRRIRDVVLHTNSMKDELVVEVRNAARLQGRQDERDSPGGS